MKYYLIEDNPSKKISNNIQILLDSNEIKDGLYHNDKYIIFINKLGKNITINQTSKDKGKSKILEFKSEKEALSYIKKLNIVDLSTESEKPIPKKVPKEEELEKIWDEKQSESLKDEEIKILNLGIDEILFGWNEVFDKVKFSESKSYGLTVSKRSDKYWVNIVFFKDKRVVFIYTYNKKKLLESGRKKRKEKRLDQAKFNDFDWDFIKRSYHGLSFDPEKRAISEIIDYILFFNNLHDSLYQKINEEKYEDLKNILKKHRTKYISRKKDIIGKRSSIFSPMISGSSRFPARKMEKLNRQLDTKTSAFYNWTKDLETSIEKELGIYESSIISSDDPNVIEKLEIKLKDLEQKKENMKEMNKFIRKNIKGKSYNRPYKDLSEEEKKQLGIFIHEIKNKLSSENITDNNKILSDNIIDLIKYYKFEGELIFPTFSLSNIGSSIRSTKKRIEKLKEQGLEETNKWEILDLKIIDNVDENRFQIKFPDKPPQSTIKKLKSQGFRWSPSRGVWQSYRGRNYKCLPVIKDYFNNRKFEISEDDLQKKLKIFNI